MLFMLAKKQLNLPVFIKAIVRLKGDRNSVDVDDSSARVEAYRRNKYISDCIGYAKIENAAYSDHSEEIDKLIKESYPEAN